LPGSKAQELYYEFLWQMKQTSCQNIVIIGGNHDSPTFLNAPGGLLKHLGIHVVGSKTENASDEVLIIKNADGESVLIVCAVPHLRERDIRSVEAFESIELKEQKLLAGITKHYQDVFSIAFDIRAKDQNHPPIVAVNGSQKCTSFGSLYCTNLWNKKLSLLIEISGGEMKGAKMYNAVQAMLAQGKSQRSISRELGINRRTVKKLSAMVISEASLYFERGVERRSGFDIGKEFIKKKLEEYPDLKSSNLYHQVREKYPELKLSERAFRNYVRKLKTKLDLTSKSQRYFEPVTEWEAGVHMQVDPGEKSVVLSNGKMMRVYFISFVLCYSRQMFIHYSTKAYDTESFIEAHLCAFQSFGGISRIGVYDQTKLVVIHEEYREVLYNERFQRFFLNLGFQAEVCEGYDPQSKGMVEKSISYIKGSFLDGREFGGIEDLRYQSNRWLQNVANERKHQTTLHKPSELFKEEKRSLQPLAIEHRPSGQRKVDKTGLISYRGRSYSVPYLYQGKIVNIHCSGSALCVTDPASGELLADWDTAKHQLRINKNSNHYVNYKKTIPEEIEQCKKALDERDIAQAEQLLTQLGENHQKHPRAQYRGLQKLLRQYDSSIWAAVIDDIMSLPVISCMRIQQLLIQKKIQSEKEKSSKTVPVNSTVIIAKNSFRGLDYYDQIATRSTL
ncbi:MAG: IS21 family transposase, partial [Candidatus Cloacimonetes bacterium]|nr:IS21 family transposase [Candidatus Cloacimonadota bacterium]